MEQEFGVTIHARTEIVQIIGEEETCEQVRQVIQALLVLVNRGMTIGTPDVVTAITMVRNGEWISSSLSMKKRLSRTVTASPFRLKRLDKRSMWIVSRTMMSLFGIGPAGTGKTFLAVTLAVTALKRGQVKRIILTRPAVEAGRALVSYQGILKKK